MIPNSHRPHRHRIKAVLHITPCESDATDATDTTNATDAATHSNSITSDVTNTALVSALNNDDGDDDPFPGATLDSITARLQRLAVKGDVVDTEPTQLSHPRVKVDSAGTNGGGDDDDKNGDDLCRVISEMEGLLERLDLT